MVTSNKQHKLKGVFRHIDDKEECVFCRSALIFAFIVLALIVMLVFVYRGDSSNRPLSPDKAPKLSPSEWNQHVLELGAIVHPELSASTSMSNKMKTIAMPPTLNTNKPLIKNSQKINNK